MQSVLKYLRQTYILFFFLGIFFIPFNSDPLKFMSFLGEYSRDSTPIFFLIGFLFLLLHDFLRAKVYLPFFTTPFSYFLLFIGAIFLSVIFNSINITDYFFKQTSGWTRFLSQFISIALAAFVFFYLSANVVKYYGARNSFLKIRKVMLISLWVVFIYGVFEFLITVFFMEFLRPIYNLFDYLPFTDAYINSYNRRISSVTFEPPALGMYLITISGFMFSYISTEKKITRFFPLLMILFLMFTSKSRTALVVILFQLVLFIYFTYVKNFRFRIFFNRVLVFGGIILSVILIYKNDVVYKTVEERIDALNFIENRSNKKSENAISNKSRLGIQYANWQVFKVFPITGAGWGMQAYEAQKYYPEWAMHNNYEFRRVYLNENIKSFPPSYNLFIRTLSETGIIGFLTLSLFLFIVFFQNYSYYIRLPNYSYLTIVLFVCFIGYILNWFQIDSFRMYGFWICLAILMQLKHLKNEKDFI